MKLYSIPLLLSLILSFNVVPPVLSQSSLADLPPNDYFDFWIGEWDLTWEDPDGSTGTGVNKIERVLNDTVIKENFEGLTGANAGYIGKSYSVYLPATDEWKQTWVDNNGGYFDFTGEFEGDRRLFSRSGVDRQGNPILQRMVFYDIQPDSFTWGWKISRDDSETWSLRWRIEYNRAN